MDNLLLTTEIDILLLLLVACFAAIALKRLQFPYTIGLVVVGLALGWLALHVEAFEILQTLSLSHDLILFVFVPPLIFDSALNLDGRLLFRNLAPILLLAVPGLLISTVVVGGILSSGTPLTFSQALLFGSLISATDPVAVIALFKELGTPKQLAVLVEGESLFNDATAIVVFNLILASSATEMGVGANPLSQGLGQFSVSFIGGMLVGGAIGYLARYLMALVKNNLLLLFTVTAVLAYGVFLLAEEVVQVSGVIALVSAGLTAGWYASNRLPPAAQEALGEFWEYSAFLANSLIFLLVGLTIAESALFEQISQTGSLLGPLSLTILAILVARALVVFGLLPLLNLISATPIERRYQVVSFWGGLRGAVCLALALSLEADLLNRDLIVMLTLGVVLFTLLIPGTTMGRLIRRLKLDRPALIEQWEQLMAQVAVKRNALKQVELVQSFQPQFQTVIDGFHQRYQQAVTDAEQALGRFIEQVDQCPENLQSLLLLTALSVEQKSYRTLYGQGLMSELVLDQFNARLALLQDGVLGGDFSFERFKFMPLESIWSRYLQVIVQWVAPDNPWLLHQQSQMTIARYEYWAILVRVSDLVSSKLKVFSEEGGASFIEVILFCLALYAQERVEAAKELNEIAQKFPEAVIAHQIEVSDRIARTFQNEAVEKLVTEGAISNGIAAQLMQPIFSK
ncbi:MAG: sodium:proton antiporter [Cyanobacteria bacterium P01_C01_bin.147]